MTRSLAVALLGAMLAACGEDGSTGSMRDLMGGCLDVERGCRDHQDDDCDTRIDCADDDCADDPACAGGAVCSGTPVPEACWDDWDDDCDGLPDCADADCALSIQCNTTCQCRAGGTRWCDVPASSAWGRQTCDGVGSWGPCTETTDRPGSCAGRAFDPECCAGVADACCQDAPATGSIGACRSTITCE